MILAVIGVVVFMNMNKKTPVPVNVIPLTPVPPTATVSPAVNISPTPSLAVISTKSPSSPTPTPTIGPVTELKIEDTKVGTGTEVKSGNTVTVNYTGRLINGAVFDSSVGKKPFSTAIGVGQVIKGWDQGILGMKVGGVRRLIIPPDLAYGSQGAGGSIPPNATLIFDIELLDVK